MVWRRPALGRGAQSALRNGTRLLGSFWVEAVLRLVYAAAIARILGADQFGIWSYTIALYALLLGFVRLGLDIQLPLRLGRARSRISGLLITSFVLKLLLLLAAALALTLLGIATETGTLQLAIFCSIFALWGRGLALFARWAFVGLERTDIVFRISITLRLIEVLLGLALLSFGAGIISLLILHALAWLSEGLISVWFLKARTGFFAGKVNKRLMKVMFARGIPLGAAGGLRQWMTSGPILMVKVFIGDLALVGQFALGQQIAVLAATSARSFYQAALPILGRASKRDDATSNRFGNATGLIALGVFAIAAGVAYWLGPAVAQLVFGPEFDLAGQLFAPFMVIGALMLVPVGYAQVLAAKAIYWPDAVASLIGAVVLVALMPWWTASFGIWGAVSATGAAWLIAAIVMIALYRRVQRT